MYRDWGFHRLYERVDHEMTDETRHADRLIRRILFLEGAPDLSRRAPLKVGKEVAEMLENDLELELKVVTSLKQNLYLILGKITIMKLKTNII
ncbi:ferritin-like domain-containing protein [Methylohalobius crimeensis]|uniref:ferritin-like domain-containing protein n=1 Tax=Methylohalobius crimeensis TaxID=244365 RepID=UPI0004103173|nr:ferritin-like domain-containing protein [Methylohalobius crimeensis]